VIHPQPAELIYMRSEFLRAVAVKVSICRDVKSCSFIDK
jgi:hypothetical protein